MPTARGHAAPACLSALKANQPARQVRPVGRIGQEPGQDVVEQGAAVRIARLAHRARRTQVPQHEIIGQQVALRFHIVVGKRFARGELVAIAEPYADRPAKAYRITQLVLPDMD